MNPLLKQVGDALRKHRGERSLRDVAEEAGVSHGTFADYETGKRPMTLNTLWKIASALRLDVIIKFRKHK